MERVAGNEFPVLDGLAPSWAVAAITLSTTGAPILKTEDIAAINSGLGAVSRGVQLSGGRKRRRTVGSKTDEGSMTLYHHGWLALLGMLIKSPSVYKRGNVYCVGLVAFDINYKYVLPGDPTQFERRIKRAMIMNGTLNGAEGDDPNKVEVPLDVMETVDVIDGKEVTTL